MFKTIRQFLGIVPKDRVEEVFRLADIAATTTVKTIGTDVVLVRKTILHRFPILFGLLVTVGVTAVLLGIEQLILKYHILSGHPELILFIGVSILAFTGKLYKKLSE